MCYSLMYTDPFLLCGGGERQGSGEHSIGNSTNLLEATYYSVRVNVRLIGRLGRKS